MSRKLDMLDKIERAWDGCARCPLHEQRTRIVHWRGSPDAKIFMVGGGPDADDDKSGRPYSGIIGRKLDEVIRLAGLNPIEDVFIANLVGCYAHGKQPPWEAVQACSPRLEQLLAVVNPEVVVLLGAFARFCSSPTGRRGEVIEVELGKRSQGPRLAHRAVPTHHPSCLNRFGDAEWFKTQMVEDIKLARRIASE